MTAGSVLRRALRLPALAAHVGLALLRANAIVAWRVVGPAERMHAAIVRVPVRVRSDAEVAALLVLLSLTPGTVPLALDAAAGVADVHFLHTRSVAAALEEVRALETRLLAVMR